MKVEMMLCAVFYRAFRISPSFECRSKQFFSTKNKSSILGIIDFDFNYLTDPKNIKEISDNIRNRKGIGDIHRLLEIHEKLKTEPNEKLMEELMAEAKKIPNTSHPDIKNYGEKPRIIKRLPQVQHKFKVKEFSDIVKELRLARTDSLSLLTGHKSYYLLNDLAELEHALVKFTLSRLIAKNFQLISVPDILDSEIVERCGMAVDGKRSQVYFLEDYHGENLCLSGTAEMSLAGLLSNTTYDTTELPLLLASVSRCYRSETSGIADERGIYRVHQFTKVEMFGMCHPEESEQLLEMFLDIQEESFKLLGLSYQVLDMPMCDLGAPAYRKFDVEAWMPGRGIYGEVSSCSDCTTYQARRLNIKYRNKEELRYVHTINGTACAIPRMLIALLETHQQPNGNIQIPEVLQPFYKGQEEIGKQRMVPKLRPKPKDKSKSKIS